jgi:hypothetical protein
VRAANDGSVYVVSPIGGPVGGCNFWSVNPGGGSAVYRGRSDNNAGGGDCDLATSAAVSPLPAGGGKDVISANSLQAVEVTGANITATSSHDGGKTFVSNPEGQPIVAVDRAWNAAGAASNPLEFYMVYRQLPGTSDMIVLHSIDGGLTFVPVRGTPVLRAGHVGNIVVSSDGQSLYVVYTNDTSESSVRLAVSHDAGTTWTQRVIHDSGGTKNYGNIFPSIALDPDNNHLYATYTDGKNIYFASAAADAGPWTEQLVPTLDGTRINVFPWIASSKPGRADLVWYGTPDATQSVTSKWNVYFARYTNSADPALSKVSDSPNHTGFICFTGTGCNGTVGTPGDRSLLDFIQISDGPDGRSHVVWTADNPGNANEPTAIMYAEELPETSTDVPETAVSLLLPLAAAVLFAGAWLVLRRRQQAQSAG